MPKALDIRPVGPCGAVSHARPTIGSGPTAPCEARRGMAAPKRFPTLVQLEQREGTLFEVLGNLTKRPYWFHSEYLKSPRAIHLEAWLVEAIFGERARAVRPRPPLTAGWPRPGSLFAALARIRAPAASPPRPHCSAPRCFLRRPGRRAHPACRVCVADPASR